MLYELFIFVNIFLNDFAVHKLVGKYLLPCIRALLLIKVNKELKGESLNV